MKKYYKYLLVLILFFIASFLFLTAYKPAVAPENPQLEFKNLKINGHIINIEIADTPEKQAKGLSGRQFMPENQGMLFVFSHPDYYSFLMKDMKFSLDFIWIKENEILEITENVKPEDYQPPETLVLKEKVDNVLEINAGIAKRLGIKEGDKVEF